MMAIEFRWASDPACVWSWGSEPKLRRLMVEFGDSLSFVWVMGGLARSYGPSYRDEEGQIGSRTDCYADLISHWLDVGAETAMPTDPRLWTQAKPTSTYPACRASVAAAEQGPEAGYRYLRRLREGLMYERKKLDHPAALEAEAGPAGLDPERFASDLASEAVRERFIADLEEVRDVPPEAREQGKTKVTEGRERISLPSARLIAGSRSTGVYGWQPYEAYRAAALELGAEPTGEWPIEPLEALQRFGRCATVELEALCDRSRTALGAELWEAAEDGSVRPVEALTGMLWESA